MAGSGHTSPLNTFKLYQVKVEGLVFNGRADLQFRIQGVLAMPRRSFVLTTSQPCEVKYLRCDQKPLSPLSPIVMMLKLSIY